MVQLRDLAAHYNAVLIWRSAGETAEVQLFGRIKCYTAARGEKQNAVSAGGELYVDEQAFFQDFGISHRYYSARIYRTKTDWIDAHYAGNAEVMLGGGYFNGQTVKNGVAGRMKYGRHPLSGRDYFMSYNGCEIMAMYNALLRLHNEHRMADLAYWGERRALLLRGAWGTNIRKLPGFFDALGYRTDTWRRWRAPRPDFDVAVRGATVALMTFWWHGEPRFWNTAVHTVTIVPMGESYTIYNYRTGAVRERTEQSVERLINDDRLAPIQLLCIRRD